MLSLIPCPSFKQYNLFHFIFTISITIRMQKHIAILLGVNFWKEAKHTEEKH